jgi:hypothetical protein
MTEKIITVTVDPRMVPDDVFKQTNGQSHDLPISADSELSDIDQVTLQAFYQHAFEGKTWSQVSEELGIPRRTLYDRRQKGAVREAFAKHVDRYLGDQWGGVCWVMAREAKSGSVPAAEWIRKMLGKGVERHEPGVVELTFARALRPPLVEIQGGQPRGARADGVRIGPTGARGTQQQAQEQQTQQMVVSTVHHSPPLRRIAA